MKEWLKFVIMFFVGILIFFFGYAQGFESGKDAIGILNGYISESEDFIFKCSYNQAYYNCADNLKFENFTGLYCDNRLVCQNQLRG